MIWKKRKRLPRRPFYQQEYECIPLEGASAVFRGLEHCIYEGDVSVKKEHIYRLGIDLAKFNDWTVITPFDLMEFKAGRPDRFNQIDYPLQKAKIAAKYYQFQKAKANVGHS